MTTRFPAGFNNAANGSTLTNMGAPDPFKFQTLADDFNIFTATDWAVVETQAGATQAGAAGSGGRILLTNTAVAADVNALTSQVASFRFVAGKRFFAKMRCFVSDVANVTMAMGFGNTITTLLPTIGAYVQKTGTAVSVNQANAGLTTATFTDTSGLAASQFFTLGMEFDGKSLNLYYGQESTTPTQDAKVASISGTSLNLNTATDLVAFFGMKNVNAIANTATIDYVMFAIER